MTPRARRALRIAWPIVAAAAIAIVVFSITGKRAVVSFSLGGRELELLRPRALYLAALAPLVLGLLPLSLVDLPRAQQRVTAAIRALFVVALALALARPSTVGERKTVATVLLVDVSDSIS